MTERPNILIIWGDDIGLSNLSCYADGVMGYRTPHIDRLAEEGVRFTTTTVSRAVPRGGRPSSPGRTPTAPA
nr:sulfatase-like hydrolase/transferase [uncultured Serinicoccus sp.]